LPYLEFLLIVAACEGRSLTKDVSLPLQQLYCMICITACVSHRKDLGRLVGYF
jgi:hypothetical protein